MLTDILTDGKHIQGDVRSERQADDFASELLLPESLLRKDMRRGEFSIPDLAKRYRVSRQALDIKLKRLGYAK
jgi:Zn-dependent peptidase ImmA (M78 family)